MGARAAVAGVGEAQSTRDVVLDVGERAFADRGFAGVSMREIAAEAGLKNQASLYHHFRDKRALYEAVLARGLAPVLAMVSEAGARVRARGDAVPTTDPLLDHLLDYLAEHPNLPRLMQRVGLDDRRYLRSTLTRVLRPLYTQGLGLLAGTPWQADELPHLVAGLYHLIFGYFANTSLLVAVAAHDPESPAAVARQRRFLQTAVAQLLGVPLTPRLGAVGHRRT